jgi:hypothetical protein
LSASRNALKLNLARQEKKSKQVVKAKLQTLPKEYRKYTPISVGFGTNYLAHIYKHCT